MPIAKKLRIATSEDKPGDRPSPHGPLQDSKYAAIFDQASDAILVVLPDGRVDSANQAAEELSGHLKSELVNHHISTLVPHDSSTARSRGFKEEFLDTEGTYEDIQIRRKDGINAFVDLSVRRVARGSASLTIALFRDVSVKKKMERELITKHSELRNAYFELERKNAELQSMQETLVQSGKMAALGELAAGIAHELNQPLQGIRGYAQEIQAIGLPALEGSKYEGEVKICFKEIISNVDKMHGIIDYLRTFTRKSTEDYAQTDVHGVIEEAVKMLSRQFKARGIELERKFGDAIPTVYANPLQLEQVFINLATNARDAIEATGRGRGTIWIRTKAVGKFVEVHFTDDGIGMNDRTKAKAFNPFFTTKEVGKGMGLGLSLSYGILNKLHGSIVVQSEIGKGATFVIRIPLDFREVA